MQFTDRAPISASRITADGFLVTEANVARTGIQLYLGSEIGMNDRAIARVWRPESEVRDPQSVKTYSHAPITLGHPTEMVDAANFTKLSKGEAGEDVVWDGNRMRIPLIVKDQATIDAIKAGTRELSAGYRAEIEIADGVTPEGEQYDAIQRNIRINHFAIVDQARGGAELRIEDARWGASPVTGEREIPMTDLKTQTVMLDGLPVLTTDAGAAAIAKLQGDIAKLNDSARDASTKHTAEIAAKDKELGDKDAKIDDLTKKVLSDEALDARVEARASLIADALILDKDIKAKGMTDEALQRAALAKVMDANLLTGKSADYVAGMFDHKVADARKADPTRKAFDGVKPAQFVGDDAAAEAAAHRKMLDSYNPEKGAN
jgi:hypothetical protein